MRVFKTKDFGKWAMQERLTDQALWQAVTEIAHGLVEANLGGQVYKKRVAVYGRGKSGGMRTLIAFKKDDKAFFMYGFAKNKRANINETELRALKLLATQLFGYSDKGLEKALKAGELIEVRNNEKVDT